MGLKDRMSDAVDTARQRQAERAAQPTPEAEHYDVVVNKGDLNVGSLTRTLNQRWRDGWRLAHVIEQHSNTVMVFERTGAVERAD
ncbi:MAG: hypothetical protein ACLGI2_15015 [Acidimicrobiia bacterium]